MTKDLDKKVAYAMELHYERGFIDGMQKQMQSSVDKAVNRMAQTQEPVAWVKEDVCDGQYIDGRPRKIWWECNKGVGTAFYTTPPQRTWVDLTDKELMDMYNEPRSDAEMIAFGREVEAKLKQKNYVAQETNS
jgi:hypothetical protein